ncbi:NADH:flavin oxidoreductase/NADH oxidase [Foetidibacter luteolus]|uniref:NADH:flavin oxidoreductase/NADH oxidase n=1 Tax=Foetidibacter luteolus TaxID=2608880 RepID=UPI00129A6D23|nr:NADH:flavin oxidoreductase/NADH oxidase [Foetidibacter luteolus]
MSQLFTPLAIKGITLKNRIAVSPMCQYSCVDGFATDWHLVHLGSRAVGGAALVMQEASAVSAEGRITPDDLGIYSDAHIEKLRQVTTFIKQQGAVAGIQLAHAGRKASHTSPWKGGRQIPANEPGGWPTVSASAVAFSDKESAPLALDEAGIDKVVTDFTAATVRALQAGYQVIEIHAAHGYLLHQFLSPLINRRTDEYGGSFDNRVRLLLRVTDAVQQVLQNGHPLFVRISGTDWAEGGWNIDESAQLSVLLKDKGVDLIDCSSGGAVPGVKIPLGPGYQVQFAERIKQQAGILTGAVGLITTAQQAEDIIAGNQADIVLLAREMLRDPYFPLHAALALGVDIPWLPQYERAKPR